MKNLIEYTGLDKVDIFKYVHIMYCLYNSSPALMVEVIIISYVTIKVTSPQTKYSCTFCKKN